MRRQGKLFAPAVVVAGRQTAGRGRGANSWWSDSSAITATFVLAADEHLPAGELPLIAGLAVRDAAAELTGEAHIQLKWPNDVVLDERKLAGLLCERVSKVDLIGVGLNVNLDPADAPPILRHTVTSLLAISGRLTDRTQALLVIASHLRQAVLRRRRQPFGQFMRDYQRHHALLGRKVSVGADSASPPVIGRVEGIDSQARLLLRNGTMLHRVVAGHVTVL
jgi:BirA family biotin operon repressor/biotin-[acetyl-CoA-carboxylase] ligase